MAPPFKLTPAQRQFHLMYMGDFMKRQAEKKLGLFWPLFFKAWFAAFPEHANIGLPVPGSPEQRPLTDAENTALGDAIKTKKGQLVNSFRNNRQKLVSASNGAADSAIAAVLSRILKLGPTKRQRAHQPIEIFQKRNPELIRAALVEAGYDLLNRRNDEDEDDDWTDESEDSPAARAKVLKSQRMRLRTRVVRGLWDEADPEEREAVDEELEAEKGRLAEGASAEKPEDELPGTPAERQEGIDGLETLFTAVHKAIFQMMGWVGFTICGGPNPRMNGDLSLKIFCFGETDEGHDFEACYSDFHKNIIQAFQEFLRLCFSEQDCAAWAAPTAASSVSDGRTVERVAPEVPEETVSATATKKKTKSKSTKKSKSKPKKTTSSTDVDATAVVPTSDDVPTPALASEDPALPSENGEMESESPGPEPMPFLPDEPEHVPSTTHRWPAGMTAPLSPEAATAIGTIERGGLPNLATMAIDPQLLDHPEDPPSCLPESTSPALFPKPKPASRTSTSTTAATAVTAEPIAVGPTVNVDGYNFPLTLASHSPAASTPATPSGSADPFRRPELFSAFASRQTPSSVFPSTPYIPSKAFQSAFNTRSPIALPTSPSRQTWAARTALSIIADHDQGKNMSQNSSSSSSPSPAPLTTSAPPAATASNPVAPPATPSAPPAATASNPVAPPATPSAPPAATASNPVAPPATLSAPPASVASHTSPAATPEPPSAPILPRSRPAVQPPKTSRKTSSASAAKKESAAAQAAKIAVVEGSVKKPRGRPRRSPLANDITNDLIDDPAEPTPPSPPSTLTTPTGTINICIDPGRFGNRYHAQAGSGEGEERKGGSRRRQEEGLGATGSGWGPPSSPLTAPPPLPPPPIPPARTSARGRPAEDGEASRRHGCASCHQGDKEGSSGRVLGTGGGSEAKGVVSAGDEALSEEAPGIKPKPSKAHIVFNDVYLVRCSTSVNPVIISLSGWERDACEAGKEEQWGGRGIGNIQKAYSDNERWRMVSRDVVWQNQRHLKARKAQGGGEAGESGGEAPWHLFLAEVRNASSNPQCPVKAARRQPPWKRQSRKTRATKGQPICRIPAGCGLPSDVESDEGDELGLILVQCRAGRPAGAAGVEEGGGQYGGERGDGNDRKVTSANNFPFWRCDARQHRWRKSAGGAGGRGARVRELPVGIG
ncbi:hypothetical protein R3P38DRAFT_2780549 [Favolaschia claudopus]|uniref:Uncharacterized protein n=1 Tax=Favolaschia claudopus TaxID=2862362 RepID=A0AAW0BAH0_9AGAR